MSETQHPRSILRSIGAVLVGVLAVIIISLGTDVVLHATGIYPPWFQPMAEGLWVLALAYRIVYGVEAQARALARAPNRNDEPSLTVGLLPRNERQTKVCR